MLWQIGSSKWYTGNLLKLTCFRPSKYRTSHTFLYLTLKISRCGSPDSIVVAVFVWLFCLNSALPFPSALALFSLLTVFWLKFIILIIPTGQFCFIYLWHFMWNSSAFISCLFLVANFQTFSIPFGFLKSCLVQTRVVQLAAQGTVPSGLLHLPRRS